MKPIAIFRHLECEGPGYLETVLQSLRLDYRIIKIDSSDPVPNNSNEFSALVFMGGPMSVNDDLPWINRELNLIRQAVDQDMPVLGHCLGGQLIAKALDAEVKPMGHKEIGWFDIKIRDNPQARAWATDLPQSMQVFHWHGEAFAIPSGATAVLESELCPNQGFVMGNTLALQCHVEMTEDLVRLWSQAYAQELLPATTGIQDAEQMLDNIDIKINDLNRYADVIYHRWLTPLLAAR